MRWLRKIRTRLFGTRFIAFHYGYSFYIRKRRIDPWGDEYVKFLGDMVYNNHRRNFIDVTE